MARADECSINADKPEEYTCDHFAIGKQNQSQGGDAGNHFKIDTDMEDYNGDTAACYVNSVFVRATSSHWQLAAR